MSQSKHYGVSLFSNCGAGDVGYRAGGFRFDVMAELDERRLAVCKLNHPRATGIPGDLRTTWPKVVQTYRNLRKKRQPALLAACPPCQGMSSAKHDRGLQADADAGCRDARNLLVTVIADVAKELQPRVIVVENVQAFLTRHIRHPESRRPIAAAKLLVDELKESYSVFPILCDLCDFGVPQSRKRTFLTFIRKDEPALAWLTEKNLTPYPLPKYAADFNGQPISLQHALKEMRLPMLDAASKEMAASNVGGGLHAVPVWSPDRYAMVAAIPPGSGRSAWQNQECPECGEVEAEAARASCPNCRGPLLRPVVRVRNGKYRLIHGFKTSTYARMSLDRPAATITTASGHVGSNNTIHPIENRLLSALECALLQTIPRRFKWGDSLKKWGHTNVREMIGEAVPPLFTELHGKVLVSLLDGRRPRALLPASNRRCTRARVKLGLPAVGD